VPSPSDADIILVQPGTQEAVDLPRDLPGKVCLDVAWAHRAIQSGAIDPQIEGWGRYLVSRNTPDYPAPHLNL
jgi:hypothetical protein